MALWVNLFVLEQENEGRMEEEEEEEEGEVWLFWVDCPFKDASDWINRWR